MNCANQTVTLSSAKAFRKDIKDKQPVFMEAGQYKREQKELSIIAGLGNAEVELGGILVDHQRYHTFLDLGQYLWMKWISGVDSGE